MIYKWARDVSAAIVRVNGAVDWRNAKMTPGEDDPAALSAGKAIAEASRGEVVGLTIGDGDASWVLARGVQQAFSVTDAEYTADNAATAAVLAAAIDWIGDVDVVAIGDSKQDPGVAPALAGLLGWPVILGLVSATAEDGRVAAIRRAGNTEKTFSIAPPVVLGMAAESEITVTPGMKELLAARKRPLTQVTVADLGLDVADVVTSRGTQKPDVTPVRVFEGEPVAVAEQLLSALRAEGVL